MTTVRGRVSTCFTLSVRVANGRSGAMTACACHCHVQGAVVHTTPSRAWQDPGRIAAVSHLTRPGPVRQGRETPGCKILEGSARLWRSVQSISWVIALRPAKLSDQALDDQPSQQDSECDFGRRETARCSTRRATSGARRRRPLGMARNTAGEAGHRGDAPVPGPRDCPVCAPSDKGFSPDLSTG